MLNEDKIIRIFCIVDNLLKRIGHKEDIRCLLSDSEVITTAIVSALYFGGHQDNARGFMQMMGLSSHILDNIYRHKSKIALEIGKIVTEANSKIE